jgi:Putative metal-binding motif
MHDTRTDKAVRRGRVALLALVTALCSLTVAPAALAQAPPPLDADRDGYPAARDCNDANPAINPGAQEIRGNDVDENCDGKRPDRDGDGFLASADNAGSGRPADCDDKRKDVNPRARELPGNGVDENCDGVFADRDGDGFLAPLDCDDRSEDVNPHAAEVPGNRVDENCDGKSPDRDGDGFFAAADNSGSARPADCDDRDDDVSPGAPERFGDDDDENCDGVAESDEDEDGHGSLADCADADEQVFPGAKDAPGNGIDEDCSGGDAQALSAAAPPNPASPPPAGASPSVTAIQLTSFLTLVRIRGTVTRVGARIELLSVTAPRGARIGVRCTGRGCPRGVKTLRAGRRAVRIPGLRRHLRAGAVVEIRVTMTGRIGRYTRFRIRDDRPPARMDRCLVPGKRTPVRCS